MSFVTEAKVKRVFNELFERECVKEIHMVPMPAKDGKAAHQMCFIHFDDMPVDPDIAGGKWATLVAGDKSSFFKLKPDNKVNPATGEAYFWKVFLNNKTKPEIIE